MKNYDQLRLRRELAAEGRALQASPPSARRVRVTPPGKVGPGKVNPVPYSEVPQPDTSLIQRYSAFGNKLFLFRSRNRKKSISFKTTISNQKNLFDSIF